MFRYADAKALVRALLSAGRGAPGGTQRVADALGCHPSHVSNLRRGGRRLTPEVAARLPALAGPAERARRYVALRMDERFAASEEAREEARRGADALSARALGFDEAAVRALASEAGRRRAATCLRLHIDDPSFRPSLRRAGGCAWPPLDKPQLTEALAAARALGPSVSVAAPPDAPTGPRLADLLATTALTRLALYRVGLPDRLVRFLVWEVPEGPALAAWRQEVAAFQAEVAAWAAGGEGAPRRGALITAQAAPLTAPLAPMATSSAKGPLESGLRADAASGRKQHMTPSPLIIRTLPDGRPDVFATDDYRAYFRDYIAWRRARAEARGARWSARSLTRDVVSAAQWSNVLADPPRRDLDVGCVPALAKRMDLDPDRTRCLELRVRHDDSEDPAERARLRAAMIAIPGYRDARPVEAARFYSLATLLHLAIYELARGPSFEADPGWIHAALRLDVTQAEVARALDDLVLAGALQVDEDGRWLPNPDPVRMTGEGHRDLIHQMHLDALDATDRAAREHQDRCATGELAVRVPADRWGELCDRVRGLEARLAARMEALRQDRAAGPRAVLQLTLQLLPAGQLP